MNELLQHTGRGMARVLLRSTHAHTTTAPTPAASLLATLRVGDVLLVEGHRWISTAIKYLSQSSWSHAALFVGSRLAKAGGNPAHQFVEADLGVGVRSVGVDQFSALSTRICRPVGLDDADRDRVADFAISRIGDHYDMRNVIDLMRYLLPTPPVPTRLRRRLIAIGSGDPTRAICSTLIAQAFQSVRYPILPVRDVRGAAMPECPGCVDEVLRVRHHSLFVPRDFDVSPYFEIIKPTIVHGFDHRVLPWAEAGPAAVAT